MSPRRNPVVAGTGILLAVHTALALSVHRSSLALTAFGDIASLLLLGLATAVMLANAISTHNHTRAFWSLMAAGCVLWSANQAGWTWLEVVVRRPLPDPFIGDIVLFIHSVPLMAAVALRPHRSAEEKKLSFGTLNFLMLLAWWVFLYAFVVFPDEYVSLNVPVYSRHYDVLYSVENLLLMGAFGFAYHSARGAWKKIYRNFAFAALLYAVSSELLNAAIARNQYYTGSLYDVPIVASICWFIWAGLLARKLKPECDSVKEASSKWVGLAPRLAMLAILSLPIMGLWALFLDTSAPRLRQFRLLVALAAMIVLGFFVFVKQYRLDRELMRLLKESKHSYENLERLQTELVQKEKLAALGQLVAGAAHEINNPLAAILGYSELLANDESLASDQLSMTRKIGHQARRARDLVFDLLSFAQQTSAEKVMVDMGALLQRAALTQSLQAEAKRVAIELHAEPELPRVRGNTSQLLQAALQIISNAIDALEEVGGGRLIITLTRDGEEVVAQFSDSGPGIRDPRRVFDPFYTTKPIGKGTGLGLSAAYGVIQNHQGQILCYNKPEGGAVFVLRLPAVRHTPAVANMAEA